MIRHLSYVGCDCCGDPEEPGRDAKDARRIARHAGYTYRDGMDLCRHCQIDPHECGGKSGVRWPPDGATILPPGQYGFVTVTAEGDPPLRG